MQTVQATAVGDYIGEVLSHVSGLTGCVHSVHGQWVNVALATDDLLTIQTHRAVRTPLSLAVQWPGHGAELQPGDGFIVNAADGVLRCGAWTIATEAAVRIETKVKVHVWRGSAAAADILEHHFACQPAKGSVYEHLQANEAGRGGDIATASPFGVLFRRRVACFEAAFQAGNRAEAGRASKGLVGLGQGLTPAGDDFLQGFLLFAQAVSPREAMAEACCRHLRSQAKLDTTEISRAFWRSFLAGHAPEPVKSLADSFNAGDWPHFAKQVEAVSLIGHSSGEDFLTGVWRALRGGGPSGEYTCG